VNSEVSNKVPSTGKPAVAATTGKADIGKGFSLPGIKTWNDKEEITNKLKIDSSNTA
jgi:hypothetical protein